MNTQDTTLGERVQAGYLMLKLREAELMTPDATARALRELFPDVILPAPAEGSA